MKRLIATICFLSGVYFGANAQTKTGLEFGVNAGVNISTVGSSDGRNERTALNAGIIGEYHFTNTWSLKAKLSYDQKGWDDGQVTFGAVDPSPVNNFHINYITVPIMANWHFGPNHNWYLNFGPYVGILSSARETANGTDIKSIIIVQMGGWTRALDINLN